MTWYDIDLGEEGVQQLDLLFKEIPFGVRKTGTNSSIYCYHHGTKKDFMSYDTTRIIMYPITIHSFDERIQNAIKERFSKVKILEDILEKW